MSNATAAQMGYGGWWQRLTCNPNEVTGSHARQWVKTTANLVEPSTDRSRPLTAHEEYGRQKTLFDRLVTGLQM